VDKPTVEVVPGEAQDKVVLRNLMHLYLYDFSEHDGHDPDRHGLFEYAYLDHYWTPDGRAEGRAPFLITVDARLAGFVLKGRWSSLGDTAADHNIAEFFIMCKWRRAGIGRRVAFELFDQFRGNWEVAQRRTNIVAQQFWLSVIEEYTNGRFENLDSHHSGWDGLVQRFVLGRR
jgi:predicted acetyltransferase